MAIEKTTIEATDIFTKRSAGSTIWDKITGSNLIDWIKAITIGNNQRTNGYGYLYNWYVASDSRVFKTGWRVPTISDVDYLITQLDTTKPAYDVLYSKYDSRFGFAISLCYNRTKLSFIRHMNRTSVYQTGSSISSTGTNIWLSNESTITNGTILRAIRVNGLINKSNYPKYYGLPIRLVMDNTNPEFFNWYDGYQVLIDGVYYNTVMIGTQIWLTDYLRATKFENGDSITREENNTNWINGTTPMYCFNKEIATYSDLLRDKNIQPSGNYEPANSNIQTHISDNDIHVTTVDKSNWNAKQSELTFSTNIETDKNSTTKISAIKTFYDWVKSLLTANQISFTPSGNIVATTVQTAIEELDTIKQATLVSGTNIKTVNSNSLLGSGNIVITGGSDFLTNQVFN